MSTTAFFRHVYDPSIEDIQRVFPDYEHKSQEYWAGYYNTYRAAAGPYTPQTDAQFALRKLGPVTTSRRLTDRQRTELAELANNHPVNAAGWDAYCHILRPVQIAHVGW
jgi:hypothetical protein